MNDFVDYCVGITLLLFGISMFMIAVALVTGVIQ
jgi:hypothetical protein